MTHDLRGVLSARAVVGWRHRRDAFRGGATDDPAADGYRAVNEPRTPNLPVSDPWHWLHDNGFSWDDVNAIAAILEAGGFDITPVVEERLRAAVTRFLAEYDSDDGTSFEAIDALRAALDNNGAALP